MLKGWKQKCRKQGKQILAYRLDLACPLFVYVPKLRMFLKFLNDWKTQKNGILGQVQIIWNSKQSALK